MTPGSSTAAVMNLPADCDVGEIRRDGLLVLRTVLFAMLVSLLWKVIFFVAAFRIYQACPLEDPFFPAPLRSVWLSGGCYAGSVVAVFLALFAGSRRVLIALTGVATACLAVLCLHQQSYNDVTFLTCCWTGVWCLWMASRIDAADSDLLSDGAWLAQLILSVIFLGGAVGKMTPGYASGEVLFEIYFSGRDYWLFNILRNQFDQAALREIAGWFAWLVTGTELLCAFLWLMPQRLASWIAIAVLLNIALMSNTWLFSVLTCLMGLALVGLHTPRRNTGMPGQQLPVGQPIRLFRQDPTRL